MSFEDRASRRIQTHDLPGEVALTRRVKGRYRWVIKVKAESPPVALREVDRTIDLGKETFNKILAVVKTHGGSYVSAQRNSHFRIPRARPQRRT